MPKNKTSKLKQTLSWLKPTTHLHRLLLFVISFAVIGGSIALYRSFAYFNGYSYNCQTRPTIQYGSTGNCVKYAQFVLKNNASQNIVIDGNYLASTVQAVINLQRISGLTADGIIGPQTWGTIDWLQASGNGPASWNYSYVGGGYVCGTTTCKAGSPLFDVYACKAAPDGNRAALKVVRSSGSAITVHAEVYFQGPNYSRLGYAVGGSTTNTPFYLMSKPSSISTGLTMGVYPTAGKYIIFKPSWSSLTHC